MLQTLLITVNTGFDGLTSFGLPDPSPVATPETGIIPFSVGLAGILDPASLARLVGRGGWLLAGLAVTLTPGSTVQIGLIAPSTFSTVQVLVDNSALAFNPRYVYRPTYMPAGWRLLFRTVDEDPTPATIRIDLCPLRDAKIAARAIAATRLFELIPVAA